MSARRREGDLSQMYTLLTRTHAMTEERRAPRESRHSLGVGDRDAGADSTRRAHAHTHRVSPQRCPRAHSPSPSPLRLHNSTCALISAAQLRVHRFLLRRPSTAGLCPKPISAMRREVSRIRPAHSPASRTARAPGSGTDGCSDSISSIRISAYPVMAPSGFRRSCAAMPMNSFFSSFISRSRSRAYLSSRWVRTRASSSGGLKGLVT